MFRLWRNSAPLLRRPRRHCDVWSRWESMEGLENQQTIATGKILADLRGLVSKATMEDESKQRQPEQQIRKAQARYDRMQK